MQPELNYPRAINDKPKLILERQLSKLNRKEPERNAGFQITKSKDKTFIGFRVTYKCEGDTSNGYYFLFESDAIIELPNNGKKPKLDVVYNITRDALNALNKQFEALEDFEKLLIPKITIQLDIGMVDTIKLMLHHFEL